MSFCRTAFDLKGFVFALLLLAGLGPAFAADEGVVVGWGDNSLGQTNTPPDTNIIAIAAGAFHNLALLADGTVISWGDNAVGQRDLPANLTDVVAISAGYAHSVALRRNGRVVAWGANDSGQTNVPPGLANVKAIAAGQYFTVAMLSNGTVLAWGGSPGTNVQGLVATNIAAGGNHGLAIQSNGRVAAWGQNNFGQANPGIRVATDIAAGSDFSLCINAADGTIGAWGNSANGRLNAPGGVGFVAVAAGESHGLALRGNGRVFAWGDNTSGQTNVPAGLDKAIAIGAGASHSIALVVRPPMIVTQPVSQTASVGGSVTFSVVAKGSQPLAYRWRKNGANISGATSGSYTISPVQTNDAGSYTVVVTNISGAVTSSVATLTVNASPTISQHPQSAIVGVRSNVTFSVTAFGTAPLRYQWRKDNTNLVSATNVSLTISNVQPTNAGNYAVVVTNNYGAITSAVAVLEVRGPPGIVSQPQHRTNVLGAPTTFSVVATNADRYQWQKDQQSISAATNATYSIPSVQLSDAGSFRVILSNAYGFTTSATAVLTVVMTNAGGGEVAGWGEALAFDGSTYVDLNPPALFDVRAIAAGGQHSLVLFRNGRVQGWGVNTSGQTGPPPEATNVVEISAGGFHSLARTATGRVLAWGRNDFLQCNVPSDLPSNIVAIAAGGFHSLALLSDGTVRGWGKSSSGQTIPLPGSTPLSAITAGTDHSLGIRANRTVAGWGTNEAGQRFPPPSVTNVIAIAAGMQHSLALRGDGTVVAWGANSHGQLDIPPGVSNVIAIACGANHCLALKRDRTVVGWGLNSYGQTDVPTNVIDVIAIAAGGDRSLAITRSALRLRPPDRIAADRFRVIVEQRNGVMMRPDRAANVEVYATGNPALPLSSWTKIAQGLSSAGGVWHVQDITMETRRFYIAAEPP